MRRWVYALLALTVAVLSVLGLYLLKFSPTGSYNLAQKADLVRVDKSESRMQLLRNGEVIRSYHVSFGANPKGHKQQEGDERTPEGRYRIDARNLRSKFYRSLHISYPNAQDKQAARKRGVLPGGDIMIHGMPNGWGWAAFFLAQLNWTDGCIAVSNQEMDEVWQLVPTGTTIEIQP